MATLGICSIPDCGKPVRTGGWCNMHYSREASRGDPSNGRTPRGSVPEYLKNVVLKYTGDECLIWPFARSYGYGQCKLDGKDYRVSRYVCVQTNGEPPSPEYQAAHTCGKGRQGCVTPKHLVWKTPAGNQADRVSHGTSTRGERNASAKLTSTQVLEIRSLLGLHTQAAIGKMYGVSQGRISSIATGNTWSHLS